MSTDQLELDIQQNNNQDVLNTNVYQATNNQFAVMKRVTDFSHQIEMTKEYQTKFIENTSSLKDRLTLLLTEYYEQINDFDPLVYEDSINQFKELQSKILYIKNLIEYVKKCVEILKYNNDAIYSSSSSESPNKS